MAVVYYPKNKIMFRRDTNNAEYEQVYLNMPPDTIFYFGNDLSVLSASYFEITSSWAITASHALNAGSGQTDTASLALTASHALYSETSDFAVNSTYALSASHAPANNAPVIIESEYSRSLSLSDENKWIRFTADSCSVTVPTGSWTSFAEIFLEAAGIGSVVVTGSGGTIIYSSNTFESNAQYSVMGLKNVATNTWVLVGDRLVL